MISVVVPWRPGCPHREWAWAWVQAHYETDHPDWEIVTGTCPDGPFNRAAAILDGARKASGDVLVVADSDVYCDPTLAIEPAHQAGWSIPHLLLHRLSEGSTAQVLAGEPWQGLGYDQTNSRDRRPYKGNETGTLVVIRRDVLFDVPPDVRFVGWGQEDDAWAIALHTLVGKPWRGREDLVHLWHPAQPRLNRVVGSAEGLQLLRRYKRARRSPDLMRALIDEVAMPTKIKLDRKGIREFLKSQPVKRAVHDEAQAIANNIRDDLDIVVDDYVTDRAASSVTVREPQALFLQARDGLMTRAAAAAGHQIKKR